MRIITGASIIQYPNGFNTAYSGCCDAELNFRVVLDPGDADHEIDVVYIYTSGVPNTVEITSIGGTQYTTTPSNSVNVDISPNFVLTQGNSLQITFKYCPGGPVASTDQIQIALQCANHAGNHNFFYAIDLIDIGATYSNIIAESSAIFTDCAGQCDVKKEILHLTNPSSFPIPVTSTLSITCGFQFWLGGNPIDITNFQLPPGIWAIEMSNPGCAVTAPCDFTINFDFCGNGVSIPITHDLVACNPCGLDCRGIVINSNPISMPKITYAPDYSFNNTTGLGNYSWNGITGTDTYYQSHINLTFTPSDTGGFFSVADLTYNPFIFPPNINAGDNVDILWYFETGNLVGNNYEIQIYGDIAGLSPITIITSGSLFPNTAYQGIFNIPSFNDPGALQQTRIYVNIPGGAVSGDYLEIKNMRLQAQLVVKPNLLSQVNLDCSTLNDYNATAIGDGKSVTFQMYYHNGFADFTRVSFNPWMFDATADYSQKYGGGPITEPYSGFVVDVMASWIGAGPVPMNFLGPNNQKNFNAYINLITQNDFEIIFDFYLIQDLNDWVDLFDLDNNRKLLYSINDPNALYLTNNANSVYRQQKAFGSLIYIVDPNIITQYTGTPPRPVYYECYSDKKVMFDVRWWNSGIQAGLSEMSNPSFSLARNLNPVTELSTINPTEVTFQVYFNDVIDNAVVWLFDESLNDASVDFYQSYDSSRALIPTVVTQGQINNYIESPSQAITSMGGGLYELKFHISKNINPLGQYRIGVVCYSSTADVVNSFISNKLSVSSSADIADICCSLDVDVHWLDYVHDHNTSCFMPTLKERIKNDMYITGGAFDTCLQTLGMPSGNNFLNYLVGVQLTIYQKRDTYPTINDRSYFVYGTYFSDKDPLTGIWDNPYAELFCSDDGTTLYTSWAGRVLWNNTPLDGYKVFVGPMDQFYNRTQLSTAVGNTYVNFHNVTYNWADQDIYFEYMLIFDLSSFIPGSRGVYMAQVNQLHPMNYDDVTNPFGQILNSINVTGYKSGVGTTLANSFCSTNYDYIEVEVVENPPYTDGKLIATLNYAPFTEYSIAENESFTSTNMAQLVDVPMYDVDTDFIAASAKFKIDTTSLTPGNYQICAIRIPN